MKDTREQWFVVAHLVALGALIMTAWVLSHPAGADPPRENPDVRGVITFLTTDDIGNTLGGTFIEGSVEPDIAYEKASVRIVRDTDIYRETDDGDLVSVTTHEMAEGQAVEAWFTNWVIEYASGGKRLDAPEATADQIVILADTPD